MKAAAMDTPENQIESQVQRSRESLETLYTKVDNGLVLTFNMYTGKWAQPYPNGDRPLATASSVECIWPLAAVDTGSIANHVPGNLCFTHLCLNYGKRMDLPIFLYFLGRFNRRRYRHLSKLQDNDTAARNELHDLETELVRNCHLATFVRNRMSKSLGHRIRARDYITQEMHDYLMEEWISGKPHPGSKWAPVLAAGKASLVHDVMRPAFQILGWTQHDIRRIRRTVKSIQEYTGVILPTINGCPVFVHIETAPPMWGWQPGYVMMQKSLETMTKFCNNWWETVETSETLLMECIFQVSVRRMVVVADDPLGDTKLSQQREYEELLGLP